MDDKTIIQSLRASRFKSSVNKILPDVDPLSTYQKVNSVESGNVLDQRSGSLDNLVKKRDVLGKLKQRPRI